MTINYKVKSENIEFLKIALDFLHKHEKTSSMDVKSIRVLDYHWTTSDVNNLPMEIHRFKIQFDINGSQHIAGIMIKKSNTLFSYGIEVVYAMLDGHYDLILNKELTDIILES